MTEGHRKRGVQASRAKLLHALNNAGLRSQAALAERIAEQHELDRAPKEMVSRAFREQPVDPTSLERIAQALEVPAHTLMRSSDEVPVEIPQTDTTSTSSLPKARIVLAAVALLVLVIGIYFSNQPTSNLAPNFESVVVRSIDDPNATGLADTLRTVLAPKVRVASHTAAAYDELPAELIKRLRVDAVVDIDVIEQRRMVGIRVFAYTATERRTIWLASLPRIAVMNQLETLTLDISDALFSARDVPSQWLQGQEDYLLGEYYLDEPSSELNIKRAESRFQAAIRAMPGYAPAYAGLCQALLESYWMMDEQRMLDDARIACSEAESIDPAEPLVRIAMAHLTRRSGELDDALTSYANVTNEHPNYPSAYQRYSAALLDKYREAGEAKFLDSAANAAQTAANLDTQLWKSHFNLGLMAWFQGDITGAIKANEQGLERHQNEFLLANLGSLYTCVGDFERALTAYQKADELAPESYVGREFLGMLYYFLGDFESAIQSRTQAIDAIATGTPELHEMWGYLADAYLANDQISEAIEAYRRAVDIAERDFLTGYAPVTDEAHRAYYYLRLESLDPASVDTAVLKGIDGRLTEISASQIESAGHRRMTQIWLLKQDLDQAKASLDRATSPCKGYAQLPEFAALNNG